MQPNSPWLAHLLEDNELERVKIELNGSTFWSEIRRTIASTTFFKESGGDIIGVLNPSDFGRVRAELILASQHEFLISDSLIMVDGVRIFLSNVTEKGVFCLFVKLVGAFDMPRFIRTQYVSASEVALIQDLISWIEDGLKAGKSIEWLMETAKRRWKM